MNWDELVELCLESVSRSDYPNLYSWLGPNGKFYPIPQSSSHGKVASELIHDWKQKNIPEVLAAIEKNKTDIYEVMFNLKFQRIVFVGNELLVNNSTYPPNNKQRRELIDLAISTGKEKIYWDSMEDNKLIWSKEEF